MKKHTYIRILTIVLLALFSGVTDITARSLTLYWPKDENKTRRNERDELLAMIPSDGREKILARYKECLQKNAPELLEEYQTISREQDWELDDYLTFLQLRYSLADLNNATLHECTSAVFTPGITQSGDMFLHKNRDSAAKRLTMMRYERCGSRLGWIGAGDQFTVTPSFGINEKGVAIVMNSTIPTTSCHYAGLTPSELTRILLERSSSATEAAKLYASLVNKGLYFNGTRGSIFFFADNKQALIAENDATHLAIRRVSEWDFRANHWCFERMIAQSAIDKKAMLQENKKKNEIFDILTQGDGKFTNKLTVPMIHQAFRVNALPGTPDCHPPCGSATNSAATFVIDHEFPTVLSTAYIAMGPPRKTIFLPIPVGISYLPDELRNSYWGDKAFERKTDIEFEPLEKQIRELHVQSLGQARVLCRQGDFNGARKILDEYAAGVFKLATPQLRQ